MIKEYLKLAKTLETLLYEQGNVICNMKNEIVRFQNYRYEERKDYKSPERLEFDGRQACKWIFWSAVIGAFLSCCLMDPTFLWFWIGAGIGFLVYIFGIIFINLKEQEATREQNQLIDRTNYNIDQKNKQIRIQNLQKIDFLKKQISIAEQNYSQTKNALQNLYSYDVLHPKYRNLVAVCSIYEYYQTGRCNALEGHEGAYNIYENELRLDRIIGQLNVVISKLDQIRNSQYELYCALEKSNRNIRGISAHLANLNVSVNDIVTSSAISAYYSRIAAENTQAIRWIETHM